MLMVPACSVDAPDAVAAAEALPSTSTATPSAGWPAEIGAVICIPAMMPHQNTRGTSAQMP